ncbi:hypothetical protein BDW69DRAFT_204790 [Aspergillus filifer]
MAPSLKAEASPSRARDKTKDQAVALKLFVELLSYQLASPVRWVETQQQLFRSESRRFVEIGPRTILSTMAKKSAAIEAGLSPSMESTRMEFLSYYDSQSQITYQYQCSPPVEPLTSPVPATIEISAAPRPTKRPKSPVRSLTLSAIPSADVSLRAHHIVLSIAAQKLRRQFDGVSVETTIRDLSRGKSTLQNELIGDLIAEFGRVPDGVEDKTVSSLGETLQSDFSGAPGKTMSLLISRLVSSKMPAGFNHTAIQEYLASRWGLTKSHADIPLCLSVTMEPTHRLGSTEEARKFFDGVVDKYATFQGITFTSSTGAIKRADPAPSMGPDASGLGKLNEQAVRLHEAQFSSLAKYLDIDLLASRGLVSDLKSNISTLEKQLELMTEEFDERFMGGITPIFNVKQARKYDSWWNWSREDLIRLSSQILHDPSRACLSEMENRVQNLLNRWDSRCDDIASAQLDGLHRYHNSFATNVRAILEELIILGIQSLSLDPLFVHTAVPTKPETRILASGHMEYREIPRQIKHYPEVVANCLPSDRGDAVGPFVHIKTRREMDDWKYDTQATSLYHAMLDVGVTTGFSFAAKSVLITGAGPNSIAASVIQGLLSGGARIIVTTSRSLSQSAGFYQQLYRQYGAKGSSLALYPMNQASKQDCKMLVSHIYGPDSPTDGDLDYIIPFAAIPQSGEPDALGGQQELALRAMLVNLLRLVGFVRQHKQSLRIVNRPTMIVLPMSCNEGTFGGDGLYSESKIGLRTLFNRFYSESWSRYLTICGAVIGWTRGTTIMQSSNIIAEEVERLEAITFTQSEMAFNILALMTPALTALAEDAPVYADLTGGLGSMWNVKKKISAARKRLSDKQMLQSAIAEENTRQQAALSCAVAAKAEPELLPKVRRARLKPTFPPLYDLHGTDPNIEGMVDLTRVPVVVGYSELGPWGNAHTRWEIEHNGEFSLEGYIEIAWIMGLIQHVDGQVKGEPYAGWVDSATQSPIRDDEVPLKFHKQIMANAGLRLIKPTEKNSYDPSRKEFLHEVAVEGDLAPFETSKSVAEAFKLRHGDSVTLEPVSNDIYRVHIKKGAILMIPKAVPTDQVVAGLIPEGWDPARYGIPEEIVQQVDVTTLYALCCVSEAFLSAGIKDPYEVYQHIHVSELANCLGSGGGPMKVIQNMYRDRFLDRQIRGDIILEHFVNTMGAWVNMLLLSATGPLKTPVGACATAIESLDIGCDAIQTGKCKVAVVGGCDDYSEELAFEFANIKATANGAEELLKGRTPAEISRPTASSRSGFAESAGCGVQILMSASLAIEMGLPIYGVVAYTHMASDQVGRSIPAPGKGILTAARETSQAKCSPLLDLEFRRAAFDNEVSAISKRRCCSKLPVAGARPGFAYSSTVKQRVRDAQQRWGNNIRLSDSSISPIRASLATWGLTVDDIKVVSMHGTSTKANEVNEGDVINTQMEHLGRRKGNPLLSVCQKSLTGHPKAGAGAWQLNGCLQMMQDRIVPGNRNADNIDSQLRAFEHLVYPMESMKVPEVKATLLASFGFGQKGAINIMVAPQYLFASMPPSEYEDYRARTTKRQQIATQEYASRIMKNNLVQVKTKPPWNDPDAMREFFLDPTSRVVDGQILKAQQTLYIPDAKSTHDQQDSISETVQSMLESMNRSRSRTLTRSRAPSLSNPKSRGKGKGTTIGVDIEDISAINIDNETFLARNFTPSEREYCLSAPDPRASFAGRWSAKEAVFKSLRVESKGVGKGMDEIEILDGEGGPKVLLHGHAKEVAAQNGIVDIEVTISHCDEKAIAVALASRNSHFVD